MTLGEVWVALAPVVAAPSEMALVLNDTSTLPWLGVPVPVAVTVYGPAPSPVTLVTVHVVEVPPIVKSVASRPVTASVKVTVKVAVVVFVAVDVAVKPPEAIAGAVPS